MEPKKKIKKFEGLEMKEESRYRPGGGLMNLPVYEPQRQIRYIMEIPSPNGIVECWVNCERPGYNARQERINFMHESHFVHSRYEWNPIRVIIRDIHTENNSVTDVGRVLMEWFQSYSSGMRVQAYKKNLTIRMVDPVGVTMESWYLQGCFPTVVSFNDLSFDHTETELEFTLNYDRAIFNTI